MDMPQKVCDDQHVPLPPLTIVQEDAIRELVHVITQYPPDTVFFLNTWCWGWEEVIIAVAKAFGTQVSVT